MTAHEIHALSGAYALDALDDAERMRFEDHLAACPTCQDEVAELREAAGLLSGITAEEPPAALRATVLAGIRTVRPLPPVLTTDELAALRRRPRWTAVVVAAAAAAAFFGGGAVVWNATHDTVRTGNPADQVIQAADARHVTVDLPGEASATVYTSSSRNRAALVTREMGAAPNGRVYQLWLQKGGRMVPAGLMDGAGNQAVLLRGALDGATGVGITVEPAGGSEEPSTEPVAVFDFEQAT